MGTLSEFKEKIEKEHQLNSNSNEKSKVYLSRFRRAVRFIEETIEDYKTNDF